MSVEVWNYLVYALAWSILGFASGWVYTSVHQYMRRDRQEPR